jgi:predicted DNA-binding protein
MKGKMMLNFKGKKVELHAQLKKLCEEAGETMNDLVIDLIEKHLKETK